MTACTTPAPTASAEAATLATEGIISRLRRDGYWVGHGPEAPAQAEFSLLALARSLGDLYVPERCDPTAPLIRTEPTRQRDAAPFDRPEAIGWHGDFASHPDRPELSLVRVIRPDPAGGLAGAWRLTSVARVLTILRSSIEGRHALDLLSREPLPFSYREDQSPRWLMALEHREGELGMRFYEPSILRGCLTAYGEVPRRIIIALSAVKRAADAVAEVRPTGAGSLLVTSNWFALHDRIRQSVSRNRPRREALLAFVHRHSY